MTRNILAGFLITSILLLPLATRSDDFIPPQACADFSASGYFFDNYQSASYINGFLAFRLKLKAPYNDGRAMSENNIILYKQDCTAQIFPNPQPRLALPAGMQYYSIRFSSATHLDFWNDETDTKINCDGCSMDLPQLMNSGAQYASISFSAKIDGGASTVQTVNSAITQVPPKVPMLIIPGILGTEFKQDSEPVWPNVIKMAAQPKDEFLDVLQLDSAGHGRVDVLPGEVIKNIGYVFGSVDYTEKLINDLTAAGSGEVFTFPYDWRMSASDLSSALAQKISDILSTTGAQKINIVAHSFGGLVLKNYLLSLSPDQEQKIGKIVFAGVPNLGSAEAAQALIFGDDLDIPLLSADEIHKLAQNMPSIYQLLPSAEYFNHAAGYYDDLSGALNGTKIKNILNYAQSKDFLLGLGKDPALIGLAEQLHSLQMDNFDFSAKPYQVYSLSGCGIFTAKTINKMYSGDPGFLQRAVIGPKYRIDAESGDGTVLLPSSSYLNIPADHKFFAAGVKHQNLLGSDLTRPLLINLLSGAGVPGNLPHNPDTCQLQGKLITLQSDMEIEVRNANGNLLTAGYDYTSKDIAGDVNIFLPKGAQYKVTAKPTANDGQPKQVSVTNISTNNSKTYNYNNLNLNNKTLQLLANDSISGDQPDPVSEIDSQGGDSQQIPPSQVLDDNYNLIDGQINSDSVSQNAQPNTAPPQPIIVQVSQPAAEPPVNSDSNIDAGNSGSGDTSADNSDPNSGLSQPDVLASTTGSDSPKPPVQNFYITLNIPAKAESQNPQPIVIQMPAQKPPEQNNYILLFRAIYKFVKDSFNLIFF